MTAAHMVAPATSVEARRNAPRVAVAVAALAAWVAGVVHLVETPDHWRYWPALGAGFAAVGLVQAVTAFGILTRRAHMVTAAIWTNVATIAVYAVSRTVGLPWAPAIGVHGGRPALGEARVPFGVQPVGTVDYICLVAEILVVLLLAASLADRQRRRTLDALVAISGAIVALTWMPSF